MNSQHKEFPTAFLRAIGALAVVLVIALAVVPTPLAAQAFTVHLLNAKTGKPLGNKKVTVKWADGTKSLEILVDSNGLGKIDLSTVVREFFMIEGPRIGNESDRVAYIDCNEPPMALIQTAQVSEKGFVPGNKCGHPSVLQRPGEIVFWALPRPWWKPDFQ